MTTKRWLQSVIATSQQPLPQLPWAARKAAQQGVDTANRPAKVATA